jgi:hypothetical protein
MTKDAVPVGDLVYDDCCFNYILHKALILNGMSVIVDIVFIPLLVLLVLSPYRLRPVVASLRRGFGWNTRKVIVQQFSLLVMDAFLLLPFVLLLVTWRRVPCSWCIGWPASTP